MASTNDQVLSHHVLQQLPKAVLHDHLDGGLRPDTIIELAEQQGYEGLPSDNSESLAAWFHQSGAASLERYLAAFTHTLALMQLASALERVAFEAGIDLWADGVCYAEIRFAPTLHLEQGLDTEDVIEAVLAGFGRAERATGIVIRGIAVAMRNNGDSEQVARIAVGFVGEGLVGFDLAGPERGYPASRHAGSCRVARHGGLGLTIHAGEAYGPESIGQAVVQCGAARVGHGVRVVEDIWIEGGRRINVSNRGAAAGSGVHFGEMDVADFELGATAGLVLDRRIPLEVCPRSNSDTGAAAGEGEHPLGLLFRLGFNVTINTDNRLMSSVSMTDEFDNAVRHHGFGIEDLRMVTEAAMLSGFGEWSVRRRLLQDVITPGYAAV